MTKPAEPNASSATDRPGPRRLLKPALLATLVVAAVVLAFTVDLRALMQQILDTVERAGIWGPVLFIVVYAAATVFMVPGSLLTLGAGGLFGLVRGSIIVSIASTLGATLAFLVGRYLARDWVREKIEGNRSFNAIDEAVGKEGWKIVGLTRLSPVFPFTLLNYAFGLTRVKLSHYVVASWIGMMPGTVMYVYLGSLAKAATESNSFSTGEKIRYGVGLVATILVTVMVTRIAKRALGQRIGIEEAEASA